MLIKDANTFLDELIGIRTYCTDYVPKSGLYLDDVAGVSLANAADVVDMGTGKDLLLKCISTATTDVIGDVLGQLGKSYIFKTVLHDAKISMCGSDDLYGEVGNYACIKIWRGYDSDNFRKLAIKGFKLYSDRAVTKTFYIDRDTAITEEFTVNLIKGINLIPLYIDTEASEVRIIFALDDFKIGRREYYERYGYAHCNCKEMFSEGVYVDLQASPITNNPYDSSEMNWVSSGYTYGFALTAQEMCDSTTFAYYFQEVLARPILYKAAINYFLEVKNSNRLNPYTKNTKEETDQNLLRLAGGVDVVTGIKNSSDYWRALLSACDIIDKSIPDINTECIVCSGLYIKNQLP